MSNAAPTCRTRVPLGRGAVGLTIFAIVAVAALGGMLTAPAGADSASSGADAASLAPPPVKDRYDLNRWMEYQEKSGSQSVPAAAQLFHRRGIETLDSGAHSDGVRLLRGAYQLDPTFLAPRLALVRHYAFSDPSLALMELARVVELVRTNFPLQHHLATVVFFYLAIAVLLATVVAAFLVAWNRRESLRHIYEEFLLTKVPLRGARVGSWVLLALPYLIGLGMALPTLFTMGALWPWLRRSERAIFAMLLILVVSLPLAVGIFASVSVPDHPGEGPFFGTVDLAYASFSEEKLEELQQLGISNPGDPIIHFSTAWMAHRGGRDDLARSEFEVVRELWPLEPRIPNNLGNLAAVAGDFDAAESLYRQASSLDPEWAMPHYNLGQLFTREFRYAEASEELARATAFDFEMVRRLQAETLARAGEPIPMAWGWLDPQTYWDALAAAPSPRTGLELPPGWRQWIELRGSTASLLACLLSLLGLTLGFMSRKRLPIRSCTNCHTKVCRRCAKAMRNSVFCRDCSSVQNEAAAPEFSRLLLLRRRRTVGRRRSRLQTVLALLVPGFGHVAMKQLWFAWLLLAIAAPAAAVFLGLQTPFWYDARIGPMTPGVFQGGAFTVLIAVHVVSIASYLGLRAALSEGDSEPAVQKKSYNRLPRAA